MANISYIQLSKTGAKYAVEDLNAIHLTYFAEKVEELTGIIAALEARLAACEYECGITTNNSSNNSSNNSGI